MKIAILGATSEIAQDLIREWAKQSRDLSIDLFARNTNKVDQFLNAVQPNFSVNVVQISDFKDTSKCVYYDGIINFVGVGDPSKAREMSSSIQGVTFQYDDLVVEYLEKNPSCRYIFLSSGAAYGCDFTQPANENKQACFHANIVFDSEKYALAKFVTEVKHRWLAHLNIVDVRVFNYFSRHQNMASRFFITDIFRAILGNEECVVSPEPMIRDYLHSRDFCQIIDCILHHENINMAVDCYSLEPVDKYSLLKELENRYGLKWRYSSDVDVIRATGNKQNYYSEYHVLAHIGYVPVHTSLSGIIEEFDVLLNNGL